MLSKQINIEESKIFYYVYDSHLKPTLLVVHGFRGNHKALTTFARSFKNQRVILIDLPGYGNSERLKRTHNLKNYSLFLNSFANSLGLNNFSLWGHSLGGSICIQYAAMFPNLLKNLILVSPAISKKGFLETLEADYYKFTNLLPRKYRRIWVANEILDRIGGELLLKQVRGDRKKELIRSGSKNLKEAKPKVIVESALSYLKTDLIKFSKKIKTRTLIIAGAVDIIAPLNRLKEVKNSIEESELIVLPKQGHLSPLEEPAHIATLTENFIDV
jgi:pimeloyl-ACP methyl ester carboxylesterase